MATLPPFTPFDFAGLRQRTLVTFLRFATPMTLRKVTHAPYDTSSLTAAETTADYLIMGVPPEDLRAGRGGEVIGDDLQVEIHASVLPDGVLPEIGDRLLFGGYQLTINTLGIDPPSDPVLYSCGVS